MPEPIVVGADGSRESDRAVAWAAADAALRGRPLRIVHAVPSRPARAPLRAASERAERLARAGEEVVRAAREQVAEQRPDVEATAAVLAGETPDVLRREAEGAFEMVLGHRGRGGFARLLLGSTSLRMAARSPIPVVIVRGEEAGREIVAGIDLREGTEEVLDYAFEAAALSGARLRVLHAWQMPTTLIDAGYTVEDEDARPELRERVTEACEPMRRRHPRVDVVGEVLLEHPVKALTNRSRTARLLVAGGPERRWNAPGLGITSHGVIHHAHCPVVLVPARGRPSPRP